MNSNLQALHNKQLIWKGTHTQPKVETSLSGFDSLDQQLGGWPKTGLTEVRSPISIGELRLLTPFLQQQAKEGLIVFINPPAEISSQYLAYHQIPISQVMVLTPEKENGALWAAEQCLKSGACKTVMLWHPELEIHQAKRLQVASETGQCAHFVFPQNNHALSLPIPLSIELSSHQQGIEVSVTKRKGGWSPTPFIVDMRQTWHYVAQQEKRLASRTTMGEVVHFPRQWQHRA
ncbi:translesion DNA synthesis-associated protein ImuA [Vibrio ulleungensis]|jgi:cell division inhibitor SulA|uniref:Translesion DNA synthesis-associated protein ImuA n=1 Tax=Vibrio ulleungensis TaxID=2807619 RepID=A0ABS2HKE8_9VIBR|nr:translesion DNA synthesis-associated protein ImuA [Vibrio ulleungensis]MBM7036668.1 translesion DNA synthesis-associated protein ImuA [Vibrio ulleungensis]